MFIRPSMMRWFRPPKLTTRPPSSYSRRYASKFLDHEYAEEERIPDYDPARYCPIELGNMLDDTYTIMVKLGFGGTSTTWLCKERKYARALNVVDLDTSLQSSTEAMSTKSSRSAQSS